MDEPQLAVSVPSQMTSGSRESGIAKHAAMPIQIAPSGGYAICLIGPKGRVVSRSWIDPGVGAPVKSCSVGRAVVELTAFTHPGASKTGQHHKLARQAEDPSSYLSCRCSRLQLQQALRIYNRQRAQNG